ncbi:MAG: MarR family transcriptional regulator [Kordiimonas sp.]|nr:MarR family transcriptional regulator [Kordiimonas sp.]|tara:strand:- start:4463 stop:4975 length:513 start_codon:yes stop_codon:yes gene_type:complete
MNNYSKGKNEHAVQQVVEICVCHAVRKASRAATKLYDEVLSPLGLKATQFMILLVAEDLGESSVSALAREMVMDSSTVARNLRPLEKNGLLVLKTGTDRRQKLVSLSDEGRSLLYRCLPVWQETHDRLIASMGHDNQKDMLRGLQILTAAAQINMARNVIRDEDLPLSAE